MNADGTSPGRFDVTGGVYPGEDTPHLAVAGSTALIVWSGAGVQNRDIFGRRMRQDGTLLGGGPLTIAGAPLAQLTPTVAWDGSRYVVTWLDHRNEAYPDHPRGDVFGARVSSTGTVLDPAGFTVADSPLPEETPTVAASNGLWVFGYSALSNRPHSAMRVTLRTN